MSLGLKVYLDLHRVLAWAVQAAREDYHEEVALRGVAGATPAQRRKFAKALARARNNQFAALARARARPPNQGETS